MKVFIVYCYDRHTDPFIEVHETRKGADEAIDAFKASYPDMRGWAGPLAGSATWTAEKTDRLPGSRKRETELKR